MGDIHTFDHNMFPLSGLVGRFLFLEVFFFLLFFFFNILLSNISNFLLSSLGLFTTFLFLWIIRLWVVLLAHGWWVEVVSYTQAGCIHAHRQVSYRYRTGRREGIKLQARFHRHRRHRHCRRFFG